MIFSEKDCTNYVMCSQCKGRCCKELGGCWFLPDDFETLEVEYLNELIKDKQYISIAIVTQVMGFIPVYPPILHLKIRNIGADICCVSTSNGTCMCLEENGCKFNFIDRPSGGKALVPNKNGCYSIYDPVKVLTEWKKYQEILKELWDLNCEYSIEDFIEMQSKKQSN